MLFFSQVKKLFSQSPRKRPSNKFATALREIAEDFDNVKFSDEELVFLESNTKKTSFNTRINAIYPSGNNDSPLVTIVISAHQTSDDLVRCLFALGKQSDKSFQLIIIGTTPDKKYKAVFKENDVTYITLKKKYFSANAYQLATNYARGQYVLFLDASDVVHPSLIRQIRHISEEECQPDVIFCRSSFDTPLPTSKVSQINHGRLNFDEIVDPNFNHLIFLNTDIYHKAFNRNKLTEIFQLHFEATGLTPWLPLVQTLEFCKRYQKISQIHDVLIRRCHPKWRYPSLKIFCEGLKIGLGELESYLNDSLSEEQRLKILNHIVFVSVPNTLSKLYHKALNSVHMAVVYSHIAFYLDTCRKLFPDQIEDLLSITFASLHYGRHMSNRKVHCVHAYFLGLEKNEPTGLCIYEIEGLNDLKHHLVPHLTERYPVEYLQKRKYGDFYQLELLLFAVVSSRTALAVASAWMHKYGALGRKIIQVWHGNGLMKNILIPDSNRYQNDYVLASSEACRSEYSKIFAVPENNVLTFGTIQTDKYFDAKAVDNGKLIALSEFSDITSFNRLCFYAPTFRLHNHGDLPTLYCGWDYQQLDQALEQSRTALIYKKHQMLKNSKANRGIDQCDLNDSPRKFVRESFIDDIFNWVCACDVFITDFSSAMFYPLLLNKPIVFYTPDLDDFLQKNGTLIDFRKSVPGPIVESSSIKDLMEAIDKAPSYVSSDKYQEFKKFHLGACDGKAKERLIDFIDVIFEQEKSKHESKLGNPS